MQPSMRFAFHRQQFIAWAQVLLEYRHAERIPKEISIIIGKWRVAFISKYDDRVAEIEPLFDETVQLLGWTRD